jgi:hypothetical protein
VSGVFHTINVNPVKLSHINGLTFGASILTFSVIVTQVAQSSLSRNGVAQAQLISVQAGEATVLVLVIALIDVLSQELITNKFLSLKTTVSAQDVIALIQVCITLQTSSIVATPVKSNQVISLAVQSIVIANSQSVTASQVATTLVGAFQDVRYAG